jgi:hypothetical protein
MKDKDLADKQGRTVLTIWKDLREEVAKGPGKALGLDLSKSDNLKKATE